MNDRSKQSTIQEDGIDTTSCHVLTRRPVSTNIIQHQRSAVRAPLTQKGTGYELVTDGSSIPRLEASRLLEAVVVFFLTAGYDQYIGASLTHTRFLQLKRVWKLNDNQQAKKRGEEGYDPAYKYDYIFNAIIHNVRAISERASLDLCGDETTWGQQGYGEKGYTRVHVSMQSTSSTNFSTVNAMNENKKWIAKKDRGRAINKTKRVWGIEMNSARQLYLKTYGQIDTVDSMLRKCRIYNKSFKYWHSSKNHALAMAVVFAYDMYL